MYFSKTLQIPTFSSKIFLNYFFNVLDAVTTLSLKLAVLQQVAARWIRAQVEVVYSRFGF